jgi:hypothetical protein
LDEHEAIIQDLAIKYDVSLFDLKNLMPQDKIYWTDHMHVNEAGSKIKAELYADFLEQLNLIP